MMMPRRSILSTLTRFIRDLGGQVAISLAASAVAAVVLSAPELLVAVSEPDSARLLEAGPEPAAWVSPIAPDGKIAARLREAAPAADARSVSAVLIPAAFAMPMSTAWPQAVFDETSVTVARRPSPDTRIAVAPAASLRKASPPPERQKPADAMPMPIVQARLATQDGAVATMTPPSSQPAPSPLARVGDVMSRAVGGVGAAGIWTLSQASSLLPRL